MSWKHVKGREILRGFSKVGREGILGKIGVQMRQEGLCFSLFLTW